QSLVGGGGTSSGAVAATGRLGPVSVGGDVRGGDGSFSGSVTGATSITSVRVVGYLVGGAGDHTGLIQAGTSLGPATGGVDIQGDHIVSVTVNGSVFAGTNSNTLPASSLTRSGSIRAAHDIATLTVKGSLVGNDTNPVVISAVGQARPGTLTDVAIGTLTVG